MNKNQVYQALEDKMLKYADLVNVPVKPRAEEFVKIIDTNYLIATPVEDMRAYTGEDVFVRKTVLNKLESAGKLLRSISPNLRLEVMYGYRALSVQTKLFNKYKNELANKYSGEALLEATHRLVALPSISGHPTGGAVDIRINKNGVSLDFGTDVWEFVKDTFVFSPYISATAKQNRLMLRELMMDAGLAPFDGEWWHFSYGDKEWAKYYAKPAAIYEQIEFSV